MSERIRAREIKVRDEWMVSSDFAMQLEDRIQELKDYIEELRSTGDAMAQWVHPESYADPAHTIKENWLKLSQREDY